MKAPAMAHPFAINRCCIVLALAPALLAQSAFQPRLAAMAAVMDRYYRGESLEAAQRRVNALVDRFNAILEPTVALSRHIFADRVYRGPKLLDAIADLGKWTIEIVTRSQSVGTFKAEPRRWVVERTFAWFGRNRRLAKDFETSIASAEAWVLIASIRLLSRRLART